MASYFLVRKLISNFRKTVCVTKLAQLARPGVFTAVYLSNASFSSGVENKGPKTHVPKAAKSSSSEKQAQPLFGYPYTDSVTPFLCDGKIFHPSPKDSEVLEDVTKRGWGLVEDKSICWLSCYIGKIPYNEIRANVSQFSFDNGDVITRILVGRSINNEEFYSHFKFDVLEVFDFERAWGFISSPPGVLRLKLIKYPPKQDTYEDEVDIGEVFMQETGEYVDGEVFDQISGEYFESNDGALTTLADEDAMADEKRWKVIVDIPIDIDVE